MTTRTREKRRRRKALAQWRRRDAQRRYNEIVGPARAQLEALATDARVFGRTVIEYGGGLPPRRVPPSEWPVIANPPHPDGAIARLRNAGRRPDFAPFVFIDDPHAALAVVARRAESEDE